MGIRFCGLMVAMVLLASAGNAGAQTIYNWNNSGTAWTTSGNWTAVSGPGTTFPGSNTGDFAQLISPGGTASINPILNTAQTFTQLNLGSSIGGGFALSGSGSLSLGATGTGLSGLVARAGGGIYSIDLGVGTASTTTLTLSGPVTGTGGAAGGALNIGSNSTVIFKGNTVAATSGAAVTSIRGGTLVLDNSAGNPTGGQRYSTANAINLNGGASTLEFRGASAGTTFSGMTGALNGAGAGDTYLRTVQNGSAALAVNFASLARGNTSGLLYFENIGSGYIGDAGKPAAAFTVAPSVRQGLISTSTSTTIPYAVVTARSTATSSDVTARWANYTGSVAAGTTTSFTGNFGSAAVGANVLFAGDTAGTITHSGANQLAAVVFEPTATGITYNIGAGNQINTLGILVSGTKDIAVTGGSLFSTSTVGTRSLIVANPTTALTTDSNLAGSSNAVTTGGPGFIILSGTTNQVAFAATQNFNLGGGTLRVTTANFDLTTAAAPTPRFRGGVLEYDVSGASAIFSRSLGTLAGNVNFTAIAGFGATTNVGGGGFSAYAGSANGGAGNGNSLAVNIGGSGSTLFWNDSAFANPQLFLTDGYALKFGSAKSNATVNFQNAIALDGSSGAEGANTNSVAYYRTHEINVTKGFGNADDQTILRGTISGSSVTDLVKTGTGTLVLNSANNYTGNTLVQGGTLLAGNDTQSFGDSAGSGKVIIGNGATVGGSPLIAAPKIANDVFVGGGGTLRGGSGDTIQALAITKNVTFSNGANLLAVIDATTAGSLAVTGAFGRDSTSSVINIQLTDSATNPLLLDGTSATRTIATYGSRTNLVTGTYSLGDANNPFTVMGTNFTAGTWKVIVGANQLDVQFNPTPVPEPGTLFAVGAAGLAVVGGIRRFRNRGSACGAA